MTRLLRLLAIAALGASGAACADPLVGTWSVEQGETVPRGSRLTFHADGTANGADPPVVISATAPPDVGYPRGCTVTDRFAAARWWRDGPSLRFDGVVKTRELSDCLDPAANTPPTPGEYGFQWVLGDPGRSAACEVSGDQMRLSGTTAWPVLLRRQPN